MIFIRFTIMNGKKRRVEESKIREVLGGGSKKKARLVDSDDEVDMPPINESDSRRESLEGRTDSGRIPPFEPLPPAVGVYVPGSRCLTMSV